MADFHWEHVGGQEFVDFVSQIVAESQGFRGIRFGEHPLYRDIGIQSP